jgi:glutathione S-transferase
MVLGVLADIRKELFGAVFSPEYKEKLTAAASNEKIVSKIAQLSAFLGENTYLVGNHITIADVWAAYTVYIGQKIFTSAEVASPITQANLLAHQTATFGTETLAAYTSTDAWAATPIMPPAFVPWLK